MWLWHVSALEMTVLVNRPLSRAAGRRFKNVRAGGAERGVKQKRFVARHSTYKSDWKLWFAYDTLSARTFKQKTFCFSDFLYH